MNRYLLDTNHLSAYLDRRYQRNLSRLNAALGILRLWPVDEETAAEFAELFRELRSVGRVMSQFDLLIAALAPVA